MSLTEIVRARLARAHPVVFGAWAITAAFSTYFCMYAFRKPFEAGRFEGEVALVALPPIALKILYILAQVLGYTFSKFWGIKVISEMTPERRAVTLLGVIGAAHLALLLFAVTPAPWAALWLFANGVPLGMVWGLTFGFLEGRRTSEALGAGLSASYILASDAVKTVARWVVDLGVPEVWMPFVVGALFFPPLAAFTWMLQAMPPPTAEDEALRTKRVPMDAEARTAFLRAYRPGLVVLVALYAVLTAYRSFRDSFARELWDSLGYGDAPEIFALSAVPVAFGVMVALAALTAVRGNRAALLAVHGVMMSGTALIGAATLAWQLGWLDPAWWMILASLGVYVAYVPFGSMLFDRMIPALGVVGTAGFMIYVADAWGYLGTVAVLLYKNFGQGGLSYLDFFTAFSWVTSVGCTVALGATTVYFGRRTRGP